MTALVILVIVLGIYFFLASVAFYKEKRNAGAVFALNFFLGWTLIGWVVALVWAATNDAEHVVVNTKHSPAEELEKLAELKTKGVITEEEFLAKKTKILQA